MDANGYTHALLGALFALLAIIGTQSYLVRLARKAAGDSRKVKFMDLVITCDDESYSLSRLQIYLWTLVVIIAFFAIFGATHTWPVIPPTLYILMGLNVASSVASSAIYTAYEPAPSANPQPKTDPNFIHDIFFESNGSLDLPRTQMFAWTVILLGAFMLMVLLNFKHAGNAKTVKDAIELMKTMPDIPEGLVALMGISQGAYLGTKAAKALKP